MTGRKTGCNRSRPVFFGFSIFRQTSQLATEKIQNSCNRNRWSGLLQLGSVRFRSFFQSSKLDLRTLAVTEDELQYYADDDEDSAELLGKLTSEIREDGIDIDEAIHVVGQDDDDWLGHFLFNINVSNLTYPYIVHFLRILLHIYLHCT